MDDLLGPLLTVLLIAGIGWLLGIAGFVRAGRALREVAELRAELLRRPARAAPLPAVEPGPAPDIVADVLPVPAPVPVPAPIRDEQPEPDTVTPAVPPPVRPKRDWEELLTARWGVWLGAAALVLSAVFLVRYAAEQDLLGPGARCFLAALGGLALVGGAEWLHRRPSGPARLADNAPGALAAGGVGAWFAAGYMAGLVYGLLPPLPTFAALAAASLAGLALSLRFGPLVASVGVVGAFATPFLAGNDAASLTPAYLYFLLVAASALAVVRYTAWVWLGWATTVACAGLVVLAAVEAPGLAQGDLWAPALFAPATALLFLLLLPGAALDTPAGRALAHLPVLALGAAVLLLSAAAPVPAPKAAVLLLCAVMAGAGAREPRLDRLPMAGAVLFLLLLAAWGLPPWQPTGEVVATEGTTIAVLPGDWTPTALRPLLLTAVAGAVAFFAAGLWGERQRPNPLRWSVLAAAVPVLATAVLFWRVAGFQTGTAWAAAAIAVAAASTVATVRTADRPLLAGTHAAGATAALALACGTLLSAEWLTVSLSLFVPALALIENSTGLRPLRRLALVVAAVVGVRLLLNGGVLADVDGQPLFRTVLLPAYGVSAAAFAAGARLFRRGGDDLVVAVLELGSAVFVAALAVLEIRQWETGGHPASADLGFTEVAADTAALSCLSLFALHLHERSGRRAMAWAAGAGGAVSAALGVGLIVLNPALVEADTGTGPLLNPLLLAYLVPACCALGALRQGRTLPRGLQTALAVYALAALFAYVPLGVRQYFHPGAMLLSGEDVTDAESWAVSGGWLALGVGLMAAGVAWRSRPLRLSAMAVVALVAAKVFLLDTAGLGGLWRVLSFLGLGLVLIGLGSVYRRFVAVPDEPAA